MLIKSKKIIGHKVISQSGQYLGRVADLEIETIKQMIVKYHVQADPLGFLKEPLIVDASQVVEIREKEIIVKDAVVSDKEPAAGIDIEYAQ
jgi:sporulation protein YlmC with PRC-barrel domain